MSSLKHIEDYLKKKYDFRYNVILGRTFYKLKGKNANKYKLLEDFDFNSIIRELQNSNHNIGRQSLKGLLESEFVKKHNPIQEYLTNLPKWDGSTDYITEYLKSVKTTDDANFRWAFKKWFVAMIACAIDPSLINHCAIILIGKQGVGKSTWFNKLLPPELQRYFFSGRINPNDKDTLLHLSECLIIVMEEIGSFNKSQTEAFKEILTKDSIRVRRAYGIYAENYIRRASFVGSTNNKTVLNDITGNRRFLVFEAKRFLSTDIFDIHKVYSQGYTLFKNGFQYWFDLSEIQRVNNNNEQYRQISDEEQYLVKYFQKPTKIKANTLRMNASEIISKIEESEGKTGALTLSAIEMGKVLNAKGFKIINKKYLLVKKT